MRILEKPYARQNPNIDSGDFKIALSTIKSKQIFFGDNKQKFERQLSDYLGLKHVVTCNMGRGAQIFALAGLGLNAGDEIILASYNFPIVPVVIKKMGYKPVFVDIRPDTYNIDPAQIEQRITPKTKAILVTHIAGQACEMEKICALAKNHGLKIIEDVVQSFGAEHNGQKAGTFGDVSYFSFYIGKNMTTFMGAAACTNDPSIYGRMKAKADEYQMLSGGRLMRALGYGTLASALTRPRIFQFTVYPLIVGLNTLRSEWLDDFMAETFSLNAEIPDFCMQQFTNVQSAIGLSQFKRLDETIGHRINNAQLLSKLIRKDENIRLPKVREGNKHVFMYYFVGVKCREEFRRRLSYRGIDTKRDSNLACSHMEIFKDEYIHCPVAEKISKENVLIPNYPMLTDENIRDIAGRINEVLDHA